jgi:hypothetical protein
MKQCPNCKKVFADDLFFCLYDGTSLTENVAGFDPAAATEVFPTPPSVVTETARTPQPVTGPTRRSPLPYVVIAVLVLISLGLAGAVVVTNLNRFGQNSNQDQKTNEQVKAATPAPSPTRSVAPSPSQTSVANTASPKPAASPLDATGRWRGQWSTDSGTLLDFDLKLTGTGAYAVDGEIRWTLRRTVRPDKMDKIGLSATEYVRGTFDPETGKLELSGYDKDDPDGVLVMVDDYRLTVSRDGKTLTGLAKNGGKWNGHVRLSRG